MTFGVGKCLGVSKKRSRRSASKKQPQNHTNALLELVTKLFLVQKDVVISCPPIEAILHLLHGLQKLPQIGVSSCIARGTEQSGLLLKIKRPLIPTHPTRRMQHSLSSYPDPMHCVELRTPVPSSLLPSTLRSCDFRFRRGELLLRMLRHRVRVCM